MSNSDQSDIKNKESSGPSPATRATLLVAASFSTVSRRAPVLLPSPAALAYDEAIRVPLIISNPTTVSECPKRRLAHEPR